MQEPEEQLFAARAAVPGKAHVANATKSPVMVNPFREIRLMKALQSYHILITKVSLPICFASVKLIMIVFS